MAEFDLAIRNGMVVDGAANPRQRTDVAITDGRVAKVVNGEVIIEDDKETGATPGRLLRNERG